MKNLLVAACIALGMVCSHLCYADAASDQQKNCQANGIDYVKAQSFAKEVRALIQADNKAALAKMITYPLKINVVVNNKPDSHFIKNEQDFINEYPTIFNAQTRVDYLQSEEVFCNAEGASTAPGIIWFKTNPTPSIYAINSITQN